MKTLLIALAILALKYVDAQPTGKVVVLSLDPNDPEYHKQCGERPLHNPSSSNDEWDPLRVVGGNLTNVGDHGWQVAMLRSGSFLCAASILDSYCVLTAAHCATVTTANLYQFRRANNRLTPESWSQTVTASVRYSHPSYSSTSYNNDIAMFCFSTPILIDYHYTHPICLCKQDPPREGNTRAVATGWGSTFSGGASQTVLREAYMPVTNDSAATAFYGNTYFPATMIGGANVGDGLDTCQGDSGGPFKVALNGGNSDKDMQQLCQVGITSWGRGCGNVGVYARVSAYHQWIKDNHDNFLRSIGVPVPGGK